jgi:hypothetical protein
LRLRDPFFLPTTLIPTLSFAPFPENVSYFNALTACAALGLRTELSTSPTEATSLPPSVPNRLAVNAVKSSNATAA